MTSKNAPSAEPRKKGRPTGTTNKAPAGSLHLTAAEIISNLKQSAFIGQASEPAPALIKAPKYQGGTNGKASSGRIYTPAEWNDRPVLCMLLTDHQAATLKAADLNKQAAETLKQAEKATHKPPRL